MVFVLEAEQHVLGVYGVRCGAVPVGFDHRRPTSSESVQVRPNA